MKAVHHGFGKGPEILS